MPGRNYDSLYQALKRFERWGKLTESTWAIVSNMNHVQMPHAVHDRYLIVDYDVWLLGTSVKDMGHGLCTVIKVGFSPEIVLTMVKG